MCEKIEIFLNIQVFKYRYISLSQNEPNLLTTYLPRNPVHPNTVTIKPLTDDLPPAPASTLIDFDERNMTDVCFFFSSLCDFFGCTRNFQFPRRYKTKTTNKTIQVFVFLFHSFNKNIDHFFKKKL